MRDSKPGIRVQSQKRYDQEWSSAWRLSPLACTAMHSSPRLTAGMCTVHLPGGITAPATLLGGEVTLICIISPPIFPGAETGINNHVSAWPKRQWHCCGFVFSKFAFKYLNCFLNFFSPAVVNNSHYDPWTVKLWFSSLTLRKAPLSQSTPISRTCQTHPPRLPQTQSSFNTHCSETLSASYWLQSGPPLQFISFSRESFSSCVGYLLLLITALCFYPIPDIFNAVIVHC